MEQKNSLTKIVFPMTSKSPKWWRILNVFSVLLLIISIAGWTYYNLNLDKSEYYKTCPKSLDFNNYKSICEYELNNERVKYSKTSYHESTVQQSVIEGVIASVLLLLVIRNIGYYISRGD